MTLPCSSTTINDQVGQTHRAHAVSYFEQASQIKSWAHKVFTLIRLYQGYVFLLLSGVGILTLVFFTLK